MTQLSQELSAVLAPNTEKHNVKRQWGFEGELCNDPIRYNDMVYFCVPLSKQRHLDLPDNNIR